MSDPEKPNEGELILYQTQEGTVRIEVLYQSETFWLNQKRIAELFGVDLRTISYHLAEIYASGELSQAATLRRIRRVQKDTTVCIIIFLRLFATFSQGIVWADFRKCSKNRVCSIITGGYAAFRVARAVCSV